MCSSVWLALALVETTFVVADVVESISVNAVTLIPRERVQQRSAGKIEFSPLSPAETVEVGSLVPHERVQQRTAEQIEEAPRSPAEVVEEVT